MNKSITALCMTLSLVACGQSGSNNQPNDTGAASAAPNLGAALPEATDTKTLDISKSFSFDTARLIDIEFDIESARNSAADVSICTDYSEVGAEFDINFNTCALNGKLDNGAFNHSMLLTNDKESVVAVVLFQDAEMIPLYREFTVDSNQRNKADGSVQRVIVWK